MIDVGDLPPRVAATPPGNDATLEVWRNGKPREIAVRVARLPEQKG